MHTILLLIRARIWPPWLTILTAALLFTGLWLYWEFSGQPVPDYSWFWF